jgi:hypothetical protein
MGLKAPPNLPPDRHGNRAMKALGLGSGRLEHRSRQWRGRRCCAEADPKASAPAAALRLILSCEVDLRFLDHVNRVRYVFADLITGFASENSFVVLVFVSVEVVDGIAVRKFG